MQRLATCPHCQLDSPLEAVHCPHCGQPIPRQLLKPGEVIADDYHVVRIIGTGGMGEVYLATHHLTGQQVAVKVLALHLADDVDLRMRFVDEARILARLDHPHVVMLHNFKAERGRLQIIMQYVDGEGLDQIISRDGPLPAVKAAAIFAPICDALSHAHENGIIHRDLKPSNLLVDRLGKAKLTDFGIAKLTEGGADLTATGVRVGTSWFMSPEQGMNRPVDARSDIYSLGVTLYNALSGRLPFKGDSEYEVIKGHVEMSAPPIYLGTDPLDHDMEHIVQQAMAKNPADRFQTGYEMRDALLGIVQAYGRPAGRTTDGSLPLVPPDPLLAGPRDPVTPVQSLTMAEEKRASLAGLVGFVGSADDSLTPVAPPPVSTPPGRAASLDVPAKMERVPVTADPSSAVAPGALPSNAAVLAAPQAPSRRAPAWLRGWGLVLLLGLTAAAGVLVFFVMRAIHP